MFVCESRGSVKIVRLDVCVCVDIMCQTDHAMNQRGEVCVALPLITQESASIFLFIYFLFQLHLLLFNLILFCS